MHTTQNLAPRLATRPIDRASVGRGYRPTALMDRLTTRKARHEALERFCMRAKRKPDCIYAERSKPETTTLPDERLDAVILLGIEEGWVSEETLVDLLSDYYAIYAPRITAGRTDDVSFLGAAREKAEAMEAMAYARAVPTPENIDRAVREVLEDVVVSTAHAKALQRGAL